MRNKLRLLLISCISCNILFAQQITKITDYVIFGGKPAAGQTAPLAPGYAVQIGSSCTILGGTIGSYNLVKSTGNLTIGTNAVPTNIFSGGTIQLNNSNIVTGRITAANATTLPSPLVGGANIITIGSSAMLGNNAGGNIDANGSISIGGGSVFGKVTLPNPAATYIYSGPVPAGGITRVAIPNPNLPVMPDMPAITTFPVLTPGSPFNFSTSQTLNPNFSYGDITLSGNKTVTFNGPGVYVINKILNSGTSNNFVFDFKSLPGNIKIYVKGNVDLGKVKSSITGGDS